MIGDQAKNLLGSHDFLQTDGCYPTFRPAMPVSTAKSVAPLTSNSQRRRPTAVR